MRHRRNSQSVPSVGAIDFGDLRRIRPISRQFGFERGLPVDRYYIEKFLSEYQADIKGRVLEIGDDNYTRKFGATRVLQSDILHVADDNPNATIVADLTRADHIPTESFDCIIIPQTLHLIYDFRSAVETLYRIAKTGGAVLATFPGISQKSVDEWESYWQWSFTSNSAQRLFDEFFRHVTVVAHGNVLAAISFLEGIAAGELAQRELDQSDPSYEVVITVRAVKS